MPMSSFAPMAGFAPTSPRPTPGRVVGKAHPGKVRDEGLLRALFFAIDPAYIHGAGASRIWR